MAMLLRAAVLVSPLLFCKAFLDLTGPSEIEGIWKTSTILPCAYVPVKDFVQQTLTWTVVHGQRSGTIFWRDGSGDHILLSEYRGRVNVLKDIPGNVSLHILNLEVSDSGIYTCQVTWRANNDSLIVKEITTKVKVVKVAVTKPIIRAGELGLAVPAGARASLTCVAGGSPPISYRWFRSVPGGQALLLGSQAELAWDSLRPADAGTYYCEAENRAGPAQRSDTAELTVSDLPTTTLASRRDVGSSGTHHPTTDLSITVMTSKNAVRYPEKNYTTQNFQRTHVPLYLIILIAVVSAAVAFLVIFLTICIRKPKDAEVYEVKFHDSRTTSPMGHYEELISTDNNYVTEPMKSKSSEEINTKNNEYDCVGNTQESEYEVGDIV